MLDLNSLKNALLSLEDIIKQPYSEYIKDGTIQRFEYTFELAWKSIYRYLKELGYNDLFNAPKPLIREAAKLKLIDDVNAWFNFLYARNLTSHTYNEVYSDKVYSESIKFPPYVKELIKNLEKV